MPREQEELLDETFGEDGEVTNPGTRRVKDKKEEEPNKKDEEEEPIEEETSEATEEDLDDILSDRIDVEEEDEKEEGEEEPFESEEQEEEEEALASLDLDADQFEEITSSPEAFAKYAKSIQENALKQAQEEFKKELAKAKEEILMNIPEVVEKTTSRTQSIRQIRNDFLKENPDLQNKLPYVKDMTSTVATQHPDWTAKQVLDEVANRAKRDLNLSKQAEEREKERQDDPKFAGAGGRRAPEGGADNRTTQEKLLDDTFG